jgi:hypothetical protein
MDTVEDLSADQIEVLAAFGFAPEQMQTFLDGRQVVYPLATSAGQGIAILQRVGTRLRSGIVAINDPGAGVMILGRWRGLSQTAAVLFSCRELELFGAEVINARLAALLQRQGFVARVVPCPDELGDEEMTVLSRLFVVT